MPDQDGGEIVAALRAFGEAHGAQICFHDLDGRLRQQLPRDLVAHRAQPCAAAKSCALSHCMAFDVQRCREELEIRRDGFWKLCHGGVFELCLGLRDEEGLIATCFVGLFRWGGDRLPDDVLCSPHPALALRAARQLPPLKHEDECRRLHQLALMLVARVEHLVLRRVLRREPTRRDQIHGFLQSHYREEVELSALARELGLSSSRTGKVLRELYDCTWPELLASVRLHHACNLLEQSDLSVTEVAARVGFADAGYFHRVFRKQHACTPGEWRQRTSV